MGILQMGVRQGPPKEIAEVTQFLVNRLKLAFPQKQIEKVLPITPDASLRRYYRVYFQNEDCSSEKTAVAMLFDAVSSPEATGSSIDSDEAYIELSHFLGKEGVAVPGLLLDAREESLILIEDLGDRALVELARLAADTPTAGSPSTVGLPPESQAIRRAELRVAFQSAIREIQRIQSISHRDDFFAFRRSFQSATYIKEMEEFRDFLLKLRAPADSVIETADSLFAFLGPRLETFPQVLVHRDFHAWNLLVDFQNRIRVIDFQDALVATKPYDLVSLLNDRDMDSLLGKDLYRDLVVYGANSLGGEDFLYHYDRVLLQRDLKVSGRFAKLVQLRKLDHYGAWIPGTLRRIGRTLERIISFGAESPLYADFYRAVSPLFREIEEGYRQPERFM